MEKPTTSSSKNTNRMNGSNAQVSEIYYLISKFLSSGPCNGASEVLRREIEDNKLLPKRLDWTGIPHEQTYDDYDAQNYHVNTDRLKQLLQSLGPTLHQVIPVFPPREESLLTNSLLRTEKDAFLVEKDLLSVLARELKSHVDPVVSKRPQNIVLSLTGREIVGSHRKSHFLTNYFYERLQLLRRNVGHLSAVYCLLYDRHGRYIFTGADDMLVKVWSVIDGRLIATLRGLSAEVIDIDVDYENTMIAATSTDKVIRIWNLQTFAPIAVCSTQSGKVTSLMFCPFNPVGDEEGLLVFTASDGCVGFWNYTKPNGKAKFFPKPIKTNEKVRPGNAQIACASFSTGGNFLVVGGVDHIVRAYIIGSEVIKILEAEHHQDRVDSIQWCHTGIGFVTGSKDGTAKIWRFIRQEWQTITLSMKETLPDVLVSLEGVKRLYVTMVGWDLSDRFVVTASTDNVLRVWNSQNGHLIHILKGHEDHAFVIEAHPTNPRLILTAGHDGQLFVWDVVDGIAVKSFKNTIEGQGYGALFDAKWCPDGLGMAAADSHGHILLYGIGSDELFKKIPKELFFHTDYRPLIRDISGSVLDEQTQIAPHVMPPPFLVTMDGNPYPPEIQRLVPGRENCKHEQLIPNVIFNDLGEREVLGGNEMHNGVGQANNIDVMIQRLAEEQDRRGEPSTPNDSERRHSAGGQDHSYAVAVNNDLLSPREGRVGSRREGDIEGVRQSRGNWEKDNSFKGHAKSSIKSLDPGELKIHDEWRLSLANYEMDLYETENKKSRIVKPIPKSPQVEEQKPRRRKPHNNHAYSTRSMRPVGSDYEDLGAIESYEDQSASESSVRVEDMPESSSDEDNDSTDYSDWTAEAGVNLEPPKRTAHKQKIGPVGSRTSRRKISRDEESSDEESECTPVRKRKERTPNKNKKIPGSAPCPSITEVPEPYRPPEWLCETVPKKAPYYPQMGDLLIYFRQGHKMYADAVVKRNLYEIDDKTLPWLRKTDLKEEEFVKIIGMKYEIKPPRLCCLKLGILDPDGTLTCESFTIKYHDMADVLDFLVLKPAYDLALSRDWNPGDRFRCIIDDAWWFGLVECREPHLPEFSDSIFLCYKVLWDNGEKERLSPWDMEPIDEKMSTPQNGGSIMVQPKEYKSLLYTNWSEEWNGRPFKSECARIAQSFGKVMELAAAEPFLAPVDLNAYPDYAMVIEYAVDLSTIKSRLENHFYRRPNAVQFDVRYIATNAEKFNEQGSIIVRNARIVTDLCLEIIKDPTVVDPTAYYHQAQANYESPNHSGDEGPSTSRRRSHRNISLDSLNNKIEDTRPWQEKCKELLRSIFEREDSLPFRFPVNDEVYPDYSQFIDVPMDLTTIKEVLDTDCYENALQFANDLRLIFANSKNYNTNKRSKIYSMTLRLEAFCEEQLKFLLNSIKSKGKASISNSNYSQQIVDSPPQRISISLSRAGSKYHNGGSYWVANLQPGPSRSLLKQRNEDMSADTSEDDEPRTLRQRREIVTRRSQRVANKYLDVNSEDSKGGPFKSRRYEDDSDFEVPTKRRRYNDNSSDSDNNKVLVNGANHEHVTSESDSEYVAALNGTTQNGIKEPLVVPSSPEIENGHDESEYEYNDDDSDEESDSDVGVKRTNKKVTVFQSRKPKAPVLDGDDQDDEDFSEVVSSEASSESVSEDDSFDNNRNKKVNAKLKNKKTPKIVKRRNRVESSSDFHSEDESSMDSVSYRGRTRKKVRYAEDESDDDVTRNISSRGRVRRTNTQMRDFI